MQAIVLNAPSVFSKMVWPLVQKVGRTERRQLELANRLQNSQQNMLARESLEFAYIS